MVDKKVTLTVTIKKDNYEKLKKLVSQGEVSKLINKLIEEKIEVMEKAIANEYRQESQDKIIDEEAESWYNIHHHHRDKKKEDNEKKK
ncbi:hypothetical protein [endosymbiont GvMRE of Glomus versiforme]|uniref:hypothetical protein n=1 Tax=endosymbiont GvMRE of Glomus versiforme TaxID=2039283 RepID=UPI000EBD5970|nr:hypothetical protein [endosymbiont GvMRE of Glomus versiforme]RHZ35666.1 hypothetical protein GvMRE_IIg387 [endosymbiont GvMRE of Glomus versiforme]